MVWHQESGLLCYTVAQLHQAACGVTPAEESPNQEPRVQGAIAL